MGFHYRCKICSSQTLFFFSCCKSCFFLTFPVSTRPLPRSHSRRAIGRPVAGNYASNCSPPSPLPNSQTCWVSTTHCPHSEVSEPSDQIKKEYRLLEIQQLFPGDFFTAVPAVLLNRAILQLIMS